MRKLTFFSVFVLLCTFFQSNAQSGVSCTLEDANGEVVMVELILGAEIPFSIDQCFYPIQLTITAIDGMANQDVIIQVQIGSTYNQPHILPMGQASASIFPNNSAQLLDCGAIEDVQFTVVGNPMSTCLDQAFFPVEFTKFEAISTDNNKVNLIWETASENDNKGFNVERSPDGYKWETLDFVKGAGTTLEPRNYQWVDKKPYEEFNYYRLRQIDFDGDTEYSEIVVVKMNPKSEFALFPNPAGNFITLDLGEKPTIEEIELYDVRGRLVRTIPIQYRISRQNIIISDLMAGVYWVVIPSKHNTEQIKLIKQ